MIAIKELFLKYYQLGVSARGAALFMKFMRIYVRRYYSV